MVETAIEPPKCEPACGTNSHCEYGLTKSECVCNPGTSGNPYQGCGVQEKSDCSSAHCGIGAQCSVGPNGAPECICPPGYSGIPYIECYGKYTNSASSTKACCLLECLPIDSNQFFLLKFAELTLTTATVKTNYYQRIKRERLVIKIIYLVELFSSVYKDFLYSFKNTFDMRRRVYF